MNKSTAVLFEDKNALGVYRVESILPDGGVEVAIFSGPNAFDRAQSFAGSYKSLSERHANALEEIEDLNVTITRLTAENEELKEQVSVLEHNARVAPENNKALGEINKRLTAERDEAIAVRNDLIEQAALKSSCHEDMQLIMGRNNELLARIAELEAQLAKANAVNRAFANGLVDKPPVASCAAVKQKDS